MYYDNPISYSQNLFQELLYGNQPAGWDIAGTKETVAKIKREDIFSYMNTHYVSESTVVIVAGNIKREDAEDKVINSFASIKKGIAKKNVPVTENQEKSQVAIAFKETDQTHLCLGAHSFNIFHKYRYAQEIIATLLGGMMSSRLFIKIRDELSLAYYIKTEIDNNPDTGFLVTRAGVDNKKVKEAIKAITEEYKKMTRERVSAKELKKAKDYLKGKTAISLESSDALAYFHGLNELLEERKYDLEDIFSLINQVTAKDVKEAAKEIFRPENINLAIVGPHKTKNLFKKLLF